jgi:hypothetical protein
MSLKVRGNFKWRNKLGFNFELYPTNWTVINNEANTGFRNNNLGFGAIQQA